jgi:uncharacterized protein (TIRG00374 family)
MKEKILTAFKLLITFSVLTILLYQLDLNIMFELIRGSDLFLLSISFIVLVVQIILSSFRWRLLLAKINIPIDFLSTLKLMWIGLFFNQILPTGIGGDAVRVYLLKKRCLNLMNAISGVAWDRITGMIGLIILIIFGSLTALQQNNNLLAKSGLIFVSLLCFVILCALYVDRMPILGKNKFIQNYRKHIEHGRLLCLSKEVAPKIIGLSIIIQIFSVLSVFLIGSALGISLSIIGILIVVPLSILTMALPISFAGWGVREGAMITGFSLLGVSSEIAFSISILYGFGLALTSLIGGIFWLLENDNLRKQI